MHELMIQAGVKGMSERSELIPCNDNNTLITYVKQNYCIARNFSRTKIFADEPCPNFSRFNFQVLHSRAT